jgi:integrase
MRASELRALIWPNVDLDNGIIHVPQRADTWDTIGKPKSKAGNRDIPLVPMVVNTLREWRAACPHGALEFVFPNGRGNVESHTNIIHRFWDPLQIAAGITVDAGGKDGDGQPIPKAKYGLHALRHAAAGLFIAHLGWTPKRIQAVMGYASIRMTYDLYGHLFDDREGDLDALKNLKAAIVAA